MARRGRLRRALGWRRRAVGWRHFTRILRVAGLSAARFGWRLWSAARPTACRGRRDRLRRLAGGGVWILGCGQFLGFVPPVLQEFLAGPVQGMAVEPGVEELGLFAGPLRLAFGRALGFTLFARLIFADAQFKAGKVEVGADGVDVHFSALEVEAELVDEAVDLGTVLQGLVLEAGRHFGLIGLEAHLPALLACLGLFFFLVGIVHEAELVVGLRVGCAALPVFGDVLAAWLVATENICKAHFFLPFC